MVDLPFKVRLKKFLSLSKDNWQWELVAAGTLLLIGLSLILFPTPKDYYIPTPESQYSVKSEGETEWRQIVAEYKLKKGDTVRTNGQTAELQLSDKTIIKLKEHTEIVLKGREETNEVVNINQGEIYVEPLQSALRNPQSAIKVQTPAGSIIDKGTKFTVSVTDNGQNELNEQNRKEESMKGLLAVLVTVTVLEGQVLFTNPYGSEIVNADETVTASPKRPGEFGRTDPDTLVKEGVLAPDEANKIKELNKEFQANIKELDEKYTEENEEWRKDKNLLKKYREEYQKLQEERVQDIKDYLGKETYAEYTKNLNWRYWQLKELEKSGDLTEEEVEEIWKITEKFNTNEEGKVKALKDLLGNDRYVEYTKNLNPGYRRLKGLKKSGILTEEEVEKVWKVSNEFNTKLSKFHEEYQKKHPKWWNDKELWEKHMEERRPLEEGEVKAVKDALGNDKYAEYTKNLNPEYRELKEMEKSGDLTKEEVEKVWQVSEEFKTKVSELYNKYAKGDPDWWHDKELTKKHGEERKTLEEGRAEVLKDILGEERYAKLEKKRRSGAGLQPLGGEGPR
jgi:predicted transglutaminase-like cysteine proteinase